MNLTAGEPVYFISPAKLPQERRQRQADCIKEKAGDAESGLSGLVVVDVVGGGDGTVAMVLYDGIVPLERCLHSFVTLKTLKHTHTLGIPFIILTAISSRDND